MIIDCNDCAVRGAACKDCVVSVLLGVPDTLRDDERAALEALAEAGLAPRLRLVPIVPRKREVPPPRKREVPPPRKREVPPSHDDSGVA
jgi:hypothetical protein